MINMKMTSGFRPDTPERVKTAYSRIILKALLDAKNVVMENTPVDTGRLRKSITLESAPNRVSIFTNLDYALVVEEGAAPHWPPPGPIESWVRRRAKDLVRKYGLKSATFIVQRSLAGIHRKASYPPFRAHKMFDKGRAFVEKSSGSLLRSIGLEVQRTIEGG